MKISSRFTIAVHTLLAVHYFNNNNKTTSNFIAGSVGVNPVIIRGILGQLKNAGLVTIIAGKGGVYLAKKPEKITLKDIFYAVECLDDNVLFGFHENPNKECPVGSKIHLVLDERLNRIQSKLNDELSKTTLRDLLKGGNLYDNAKWL